MSLIVTADHHFKNRCVRWIMQCFRVDDSLLNANTIILIITHVQTITFMWLLFESAHYDSKADTVEQQTYDFVDTNDADFNPLPLSGFPYLIS